MCYVYVVIYIQICITYACPKVKIAKYATKMQYSFVAIVKKQNIAPFNIEINIGLNTNNNAKLLRTKKTDKFKKLLIKIGCKYVKNISKGSIIKYMMNVY